MERIKKIELNGITFEVFGQYYETRNSWGHYGYLLQDGHEIARDKIRYYNRTWEAYRFQSAGRGAVYNWLKQLQAAALERYREATGRVRLSQSLKDGIFKLDPDIQNARAILAAL
ncbi:MAG: hypothetical protein IJ714_01775 [Bacteroidales bacterium]|nr:hypothetical protein [Bacteroidales bacterium]